MSTRRDFMNAALGSLAGATLLNIRNASASNEQLPAAKPTFYRQDKPLLELQQAFLDLRFGMFIHFNMATFQDREWGDPSGPLDAFNPRKLNTDSWADAAVSAEMKYACLTTKHHDGFCLWPTKSGGDCVTRAGNKTDIVKAYVDSFRKRGIIVGLYYSILDLRGDIRHHNVTSAKIERIKTELTELLTNYGDIALLIFDGWNAPWSRISYDEVPFDEIYSLVKSLQPNCLISELNASQFPPSGLFYTDIKAFEQNAGQKLPEESHIPAQSCVTLTDGWFWKQGDERRPLKSADEVVNRWLRAQNARSCNLICNAAPNRDGEFAPNILAQLSEIGDLLRTSPPTAIPTIKPSVVITTHNIAQDQPIHAISSDDTYGPDLMNDGDFGNSWYLPSEFTEGWVEIELAAPLQTGSQRAESKLVSFNTFAFSEPIGRWPDYQTSRISHYKLEAWDGAGWREILADTRTSPARLHTLQRVSAAKVRLTIRKSASQPHIAEIGVYNEPDRKA
ncbi:MAG TPA: alpha-L-fucosidase, partial [Phycisphaerales bacterium]|nr:alpha-L-fucosidase [Phycisphaerales bacterium]